MDAADDGAGERERGLRGRGPQRRDGHQAVDAQVLLRERGLAYVSRWANATINRWCLRYNFAAKTEWPWLGQK